MNRLDQSHSKVKWMRLGVIWALMFTLVAVNWRCSKDEVKYDEYYIKYEVNSSTIYSGGKLDVDFTAENNQYFNMQIPTRTSWEIIIGPVKKGFRASLKVSEAGNNYGHLRLYAKISVRKNDSPFALKEFDDSDEPRTSVEINYTIDY